MRIWFLYDSIRFGQERRAVEALAASEDWFTIERWALVGFRMSVEGVIRVGDAAYPVRLIFPDQFPAVPAWVEPQDPQAKWSQHQYGAGGTLCLELRPDNWVSAAKGADVLRSAYNLLAKENPLGPEKSQGTVASAHVSNEILEFLWKQPVLIGAGLVGRMRAGEAGAVRAVTWPLIDKQVRALIFDDQDRIAAHRPDGLDDTAILWSTALAPPSNATPSRGELAKAAGLDADRTAEVVAAQAAFLLFVNDSLVAYHLIGPDTFRCPVTVLADDAGLRSSRSASTGEKRVAIIGAGSIGSKVAEILVRSGTEHLRLVDGDIFLPGNLERHTLDWRDVGLRKVSAVRRRLSAIAPGVDVEVIDDNLNWQRSARTHEWQVQAIANCDVVVDATGDVPTALFLGALAFANGKSFVSVVVFEGGLGAMIAISVPGKDPPFAVGRGGFQNWCADCNVEVPPSGARRYEALDPDGSPVVADDAAVTIAAGHAARVVLDVLDGVAGDRANPWMLIGLKKGWIFESHGHVVQLNVGEPPPPTTSPQDDEALAFAIRLTEEALRAAKDRE